MKVRIKFKKSGAMKFVGHLDVMRYFQKAINRAEIDICYSQGYNPHQQMSFASPLGVGLTSDSEYVDLLLNETESGEKMMKRINDVMVEGFEVVEFRQLSDDSQNAMSSVAAADYLISIKDGYQISENAEFNFEQAFQEFFAQDKIEILKKSKKSERVVDIKPWIYEMISDTSKKYENSVAERYENGNVIALKLSTGSVNNLKPELVLEAFSNYLGVEYNPYAYQIHRLEVYENLQPVSENERPDLTKLVPLDYKTTEIL